MAWWKTHGRIRGMVKAHEAKAHGRIGRRAADRGAIDEGVAEHLEDAAIPDRVAPVRVPAKKLR